MDRFEIVDPRSNGEAIFSAVRPKWLWNPKTVKMVMSRTKQAGSQYTLSKPLSCPKNGETLKPLKITAVDIDEKCLEITRQRVTLHNEICVRKIEDLFAKKLSFDTVIMSHVLEHIYRPVDTVRQVLSLLRPGGILILVVPNPLRPSVFLGALWQWHYVNRGHVYSWDRSHWINFLENILSLNVICYSQDYVPLFPFLTELRLLRPLEKLLAKVLPWLTFSNIAVIRNSFPAFERPKYR